MQVKLNRWQFPIYLRMLLPEAARCPLAAQRRAT